MFLVDVSEVKPSGETKQNNIPPQCGQPIDHRMGRFSHATNSYMPIKASYLQNVYVSFVTM
jgi:hypothetical protein